MDNCLILMLNIQWPRSKKSIYVMLPLNQMYEKKFQIYGIK